jgi:SAM-dependent methyltransferase
MEPLRDDDRQRRYYAETAAAYDAGHLHEPEHRLALAVMLGVVDYAGIGSVLDVGSGTGRAIRHIKQARGDLVIRGVEPVAELREIAYANGVSRLELTDGNGLRLEFDDGAFDLVCAFGVLHHVRTPDKVIAEMLRVARKAVFISDSNNFGQGSWPVRTIKQALHAFGLWGAANLLKTRGRGYRESAGDGLAYSYSLFSSHAQIRRQCSTVHVINTTGADANAYRTASHVAILGLKR